MSHAAKRRTLTGCRRRKPKRQASSNERWLHLSSREACDLRTMNTMMTTTSFFCTALNHLRVLVLAAETVVTAPTDLAILHPPCGVRLSVSHPRGLPWPTQRYDCV